MDLLQLVNEVEKQCEALARKADTVIKLWSQAQNIKEEREQGNLSKAQMLDGLWETRFNMNVNLGRIAFELGMLHIHTNDCVLKLEYLDAKRALLERVLKPMIQTQEVINRAQGAADMVSQMLQDVVEQ